MCPIGCRPSLHLCPLPVFAADEEMAGFTVKRSGLDLGRAAVFSGGFTPRDRNPHVFDRPAVGAECGCHGSILLISLSESKVFGRLCFATGGRPTYVGRSLRLNSAAIFWRILWSNGFSGGSGVSTATATGGRREGGTRCPCSCGTGSSSLAIALSLYLSDL